MTRDEIALLRSKLDEADRLAGAAIRELERYRKEASFASALKSFQWEPIETAPKRNRFRAIICVTNDLSKETSAMQQVVVDEFGEHVIGEAMWHESDVYGDDWWWAGSKPGDIHTDCVSDMNFGKVTHWMPLPEPPK